METVERLSRLAVDPVWMTRARRLPREAGHNPSEEVIAEALQQAHGHSARLDSWPLILVMFELNRPCYQSM